MKKSKVLINITDLEEIEKYKKIGITNFLFALNNFSIGYNSFKLKELKTLDVNVYLNINLIMDTKTINEFKKIIKDLDFIKGIFFEDLGIYYILKDTNIPLIWNQSHFGINSRSINFWLERVKSAVLSNELTLDEINYILSKVTNKVVLNVYGLNAAMYSRRPILSFFSKHKNINLVKEGFLKVHNQDISYKAKENDKGTILFYDKPFNYVPYLEKIDDSKILFYLINDLKFEEFDNLKSLKNTEEKFLHEKTIYKLED